MPHHPDDQPATERLADFVARTNRLYDAKASAVGDDGWPAPGSLAERYRGAEPLRLRHRRPLSAPSAPGFPTADPLPEQILRPTDIDYITVRDPYRDPTLDRFPPERWTSQPGSAQAEWLGRLATFPTREEETHALAQRLGIVLIRRPPSTITPAEAAQLMTAFRRRAGLGET